MSRDCPGVSTSSGPGKEVAYHGAGGGTSVGYKSNSQQHSPQSRVSAQPPSAPVSHFSQDPTGPQPNSPPLRINIYGQVSNFIL